ncbi:MAG: HAD-IB family hydrolase [Pseudomonadota bacterium]
MKNNSLQDLVQSIYDAPKGPQTCAFFDFDGTIISGFSAVAYLRQQLTRGDFSLAELSEMASAMTRFGLGDLGFSAMMAATMQFMRGTTEQEFIDFSAYMYEKHIAKAIYPESRALIEAHQACGHTVAVISSATPYQVRPAAKDLGIDEVRCTELEVVDGEFTGRVLQPTCFGPGKVAAAHEIADAHGTTLGQSFFYSDSTDDIELLESVGHPVALNPNKKLAVIAETRQWARARFSSRGRAGLMQWVRSIAATGSLATSFVAALPILALTGSKRRMQNFSYALFAETASALIGLDLDIEGEQNVWEKRPAVFVFNHQSKADVVIILQLLRRDLAGVGKKEIRNMPVIGQVMQMGGAVLIDRQNSKSAIEAMQPLVDVMRDEGKSVVMAPEGTRTITPKLNPFKKGAFHLAMQAGVPIVPIVIHNSIDVAPKGDFVFRPATVKVEVLPPVDTTDWQRDTIDEHVAFVRDQFLVALGQKEPVETKKRAKRSSKKRPAKRATRKKTTKKKSSVKKTKPSVVASDNPSAPTSDNV